MHKFACHCWLALLLFLPPKHSLTLFETDVTQWKKDNISSVARTLWRKTEPLEAATEDPVWKNDWAYWKRG